MEEKREIFLGETKDYRMYKTVAPASCLIFAVVSVLLFWNDGAPFIYFGFAMSAMMLALFVLCVLLPKNAVAYDEEAKVLIVRSGKTLLGSLRKQVIPLQQIEGVSGKPYDNVTGFFFGLAGAIAANHKKGLVICFDKKTLNIKTVAQPQVVAERIKALLVSEGFISAETPQE